MPKRNSKTDRRIPGSVFSARARNQIELEVVSSEARLRLTRLLRMATKPRIVNEESHQIEIVQQNQIINIANLALIRPIYVLELADWDYGAAEYAWHRGELELVMRRPDTPQLVEIIADLIRDGALSDSDVNDILEADGCGIRFNERDSEIEIELINVADLPDVDIAADEHPNVRRLFDRMDHAMQTEDWPLVLFTSASIFETVAKQVVPNPKVQDQSLGGWFSLYRKHSKLSAPLLDIVEDIFKRRNIEPLAGHGSARDPSATREEAVQVRELTYAFVRLERVLSGVSLESTPMPRNTAPSTEP